LSPTNPKWISLRSNPNIYGERQETSRQSHGRLCLMFLAALIVTHTLIIHHVITPYGLIWGTRNSQRSCIHRVSLVNRTAVGSISSAYAPGRYQLTKSRLSLQISRCVL
jgi:hypothetical protein